ncbi:MAG: response regulator transcription factor [Alkalispirochaetaceae bacterium]
MARVLLLDDQPLTREVLKVLLAKRGHQVCAECGSDEVAIRAFNSCAPDLAILDVETSGPLGGPGVLKQAREDGYQGGAIFLSGCSWQNVADRLAGLTFNAYLQKPAEIRAISREIDAAVCSQTSIPD